MTTRVEPTKGQGAPFVATARDRSVGGRCPCGGVTQQGGECAACRSRRLGGTAQRRAPQGGLAAVPLHRGPSQAMPSMAVRHFSIGPQAPGAPDKSVDERSEIQDQSASVAIYSSTAAGVHMEVDAQNVFVSPKYPDGFKWTQTIATNVPLGGASSPYVDPQPNDDAKPFYWTDAEHAANPTRFIDFPKRAAPAVGTTTWDATLCLNGVNEANKTVTTFDCLSYGFSRDSAGAVSRHSVGSSWGIGHRSTLRSAFPAWSFDTVGHAGLGALTGALTGAGVGALVGGPIGALIGGAIGALAGAIAGSFL